MRGYAGGVAVLLVLAGCSLQAPGNSADVGVALTMPAPFTPGATIASVVVVLSNNGPTTARGMAGSLQLAPGLEHVAVSELPDGMSARYDGTSGQIDLSGVPDIAADQSLVFELSFLVPLTHEVTVSANLTTSSDQGSNITPDEATVTMSALAYDPPITITTGGTYTGNWRSTDPETAAITIDTTEPVVIDGANILAAGDGINAPSGAYDLTIRNVNAMATYTNQSGLRKGNFVNAGNFQSLTVEHTWSANFGDGIRALNFVPDPPANQMLMVRFNEMRNLDGRLSDGAGGYDTTRWEGANAVGMNTLSPVVAEIAWNEVINRPGESSVEDLISTYASSGTATQPILIHNNYLQGGYPPDVTAFAPFTGCSIQIGDDPTRADRGHTQAYDNQIVSFSNCGIGITSGHDQQAFRNRIISARVSPEGVPLNGTTRAPILLWDYYSHQDPFEEPQVNPYWYGNTLRDNDYSVAGADGSLADAFLVDTTGNVVSGNRNPWNRVATREDTLDEYQRWILKRAQSPEPIGPLR